MERLAYFYEMFVPGAPGFLTHNINTDIGLARDFRQFLGLSYL